VCLILLFLTPAGAQVGAPDTTVTTTVVTGTTPATVLPSLPVPENVTSGPPPILILGVPDIDNLTVTMYGTAAPGSVNVSIDTILWDWGDGTGTEYHHFPASHVYAVPGNYTISVSAIQSDGQSVTRSTNITLGEPAAPPTVPPMTSAPGTPGLPAGAPVLTLLEPIIDGLNVTLNGNLNPGSPGLTIASVDVEWSDGNVSNLTDLPATHRYSAAGTYTISITGTQSDGQSTTKKIIVDLKNGEGAPGTVPPEPPPGDLSVYLVILLTALAVVIIGAIAQRILQRKASGPPPGRGGPPKPASRRLPSREDLLAVCTGTDVLPEVLDAVIMVAVEIAREGREGQAVGTSFVVGDTENVLSQSKQFVLNPFHGHPEAERQVTDAATWGHIKEFAQLDGAFIISGTGLIEAAGRYITSDTSQVNLPGGLGSRHSSVAGITQLTRSIGIVVSQSGGLVSIIRDGRIVRTVSS
jgi:DNA integrity scanning protein DisA with diadenylate cyclase activity